MLKKIPPIPHQLYEKFNKDRSFCLNLSNQLRVFAKTTISFLIKDNIKTAEKNLPEMKKMLSKIQANVRKNPHLYSVAGINSGIEEYIEAVLLYEYISGKQLSSIDKFGVMPETYFGGLSDMTGELVRLARRHNDKAEEVHDYIVRIYDSLIPVSITRNSAVRNKLEAVGNNLKRVESIIYDLRLRDKI